MWLPTPRRLNGNWSLAVLWCYLFPHCTYWIQDHIDPEAWLIFNTNEWLHAAQVNSAIGAPYSLSNYLLNYEHPFPFSNEKGDMSFSKTLKHLTSRSRHCSSWFCRFRYVWFGQDKSTNKNRFISHFYTFCTKREENYATFFLLRGIGSL